MRAGTCAANIAWAAGNLVAAGRFAVALREPAAAQAAWLRNRLARDAASAFGREHGFAGLRDYAGFARRVPVRTWVDFEPWIRRVQAGEAAVLTNERVTHLAPTSGSSGARKLIPFTAGLQAGFSAAVGAWMTDLVRTRPAVLGGASYWAVSPAVDTDVNDGTGPVPVGFADDAEYLGGLRAWLVRHALGVPGDLRHERDPETFWLRTLICLLARRDLRLISVWHPSFLELLLAAADRHWAAIGSLLADRTRAAELGRLGPRAWTRWWPRLQAISCWGDQAAEPGWRDLGRRFPGVLVQAKGLLATEAAVTIPWRGAYPLAVTAHFFEFIDEAGDVRRAHELDPGRSYETVVTNGGGLWRYRLGDRVECTGRVAATPTLRFLGRAGNVSDLCGEKLSEPFVAEVLRALWPEGERPRLALLRARDDTAGYDLLLSGGLAEGTVERLEAALSANPHYAAARRLGQLAKVRPILVPNEAALDFGRPERIRLGDAKPTVLRGRDRNCAARQPAA
jgi:hypothetical protein